MAKSKDVKAGGAWVEIFADNSPLRRTLKASGKLLSNFAQPVMAASKLLGGGFAIAATAAAAATRTFANYADAIGDMSNRTGASVKFLSEMGYAAKMSGSELEALEPALRNMQKGLVSGSAKPMLKQLGLDAETLKAMSPEEQFLTIADSISRLASPAEKTAAAMAIFGKSGTALVPMLSEGRAEIEAMRQEARDLGVSLDNEAAAKAGAFNDALDKVMIAGQGIANVIGTALAPMLTWLAEAMAKQVAGLGKWLSGVLEFVGSYENAMATLKLAWVTTVATLEGFWDTVVSNLAPPIVTAFTYIEGFFDQTITAMLKGWEQVAAEMKMIANDIAQAVGDSFRNAIMQVKNLAGKLGALVPALKTVVQGVMDGMDAAAGFSTVAEYGLGKAAANAAEVNDQNIAELDKGLERRKALRDNRIATAGDAGALEARRQARQAEIDAATNELNATMAQTRQAAADAAAEAQKQKDQVSGAALDAYGKTGAETAGTFNAAAVFGMGASSVQVDMLRVLREVAANGAELNGLVAEGGMA